VLAMILTQLEDYSEEQLVTELKNTKACLRVAQMNYEFEEQNIQKEKITLLRKELERRRSNHQLIFIKSRKVV
jgi:hypothetical protein